MAHGEREYRPTLEKKYLEPDQVNLFLVAYNHFTYGGRPLMRDEVRGLMAIHLNRESVPLYSEMFDHFDNPADTFTIHTEEKIDGSLQMLLGRVADLFDKYLENDAEAQETADDLMGLKKRIRVPKRGSTWPLWDCKDIRFSRLLLIHALLHWCKDGQGNDMSDDLAREIVREYVFLTSSRSSVFTTLRLPKRDISQAVAQNLEDRECAKFFGKWALTVYKKFAFDKRHSTPRLVLPFPGPDPEDSEDLESPTAGPSQPTSGESREIQKTKTAHPWWPPQYLELGEVSLVSNVWYKSNPLPKGELFFLFAAYNWYFRNGRYLVREEVTFMQDHLHNTISVVNHRMFDRFEDPTDRMTIGFEKLRDKYENVLCGRVHNLIKEVRENDPEAKAFEEAFEGFKGRFESLGMLEKDKPVIYHQKSHEYQLFEIFPLINGLIGGEEKNIVYVAKKVYGKYIGVDMKSGNVPIFKRLMNKGDPLTAKVNKYMATKKDYRDHWGPKASNMLEEWKRNPKIIVRPQPVRPKPIMDTASQDDPLSATTSSLGNLSMQATAPGPSQPTASGPSHPSGEAQPQLGFPGNMAGSSRRRELEEEQRQKDKAKSTRRSRSPDPTGPSGKQPRRRTPPPGSPKQQSSGQSSGGRRRPGK